MAFNHRKLISASEKIDIDPCDIFCDITRNPDGDGYCPPSCIDRCPFICIHSIPSLIPPPPPPPPPTSIQDKILKLPLPVLASLSILLALSFLLGCYTLYKFYKKWDELRNRRRRRSPEAQQEETHDQFLDEDHGPVVDHPIWYIRTVGLQASVINSIAICKYKRGDGLVEGTECSVCLNEFQEDETLRLLSKCNHAFHIPCIDTWLRSHTNCPLCRAEIEAGTPTVTTEEQPSVNNPGVGEGNQVVVSESGSDSGEFRREREDGELMGIEEEGERERANREKSLVTREEEVVHQRKRRSVSMDCVSASMIRLAIANAYQGEIAGNSDSQMHKANGKSVEIVSESVDVNCSLLKLVGGSSVGRSLQKGPISMKRSLSCSGKVLFSRYAQGQNSTLPS